MKKTLLLLFTLLTLGVSGAWAASPAPGAYPLEGKTYYLFANKYNSTDRYYLYWDNTNSALKRAAANTKESANYYKWTVTVSDGKYYITNVGTGTKLAWDDSKGLTLKSEGTLFDLSKTVHYTACVSLYNPSGFWCCVESSQETFRNGLKFSNYPNDANSATYPVDFVFEEVLSAHSLVDGSYYTIYCDNDNKQYIYDNAGTLAQTSSAPASDLRYIWQCIVSGDYYNFRNLQSGKYLGWRAMSASAYNYTITIDQAIHDGCATMWGVSAGRNWSIKTDGTLTGQTTTKDNKVNTDWCTDFRFDAIDLSDWCTGDLLGGSISGSDNWTNTWTSGTSPSFTLTASANNINHKDDRTTGGLDIRSGSALTSTYSITAPGYIVTGYKIAGYALNGAQTVTPSKGGVATEFTTAGNSISVSGLRQKKASFTLSGANDGLFIRAMQVSLASVPSSITSLPTANNKAYVIYNERAAWNFVNNATSMNADNNMDLDNEQQRIALIYHNENYYLYSINAGKYLTANNTLTSVVTDNEQISITATGNATYPWFFSFKNVANKNINIDGNPAVVINWYSTPDEGNQNAIIEADDFDATEALAMFNNRYVTYNLSYGGNSTFRTVNNVVVAIGGDPADYVPEAWKAAYCTLTYDVETIEESTATINVTSTWDGPFDLSTDYASATWYYMTLGGQWATYEGNNSQTLTNEQQSGDGALWAFVGNPYDGLQIINKGAGDGLYLLADQSSSMVNSGHTYYDDTFCKIFERTSGFILQEPTGHYFYAYSGDMSWSEDGDGAANLFTVRSYYCQKLIEDLYAWADANHRNELFGPSETWLSNMTSNVISMYPNMSKTTYDGITIPDAFGAIVPNYPTTGYYRIKSSGQRSIGESYIGYGSSVYGTGLRTVAAANKLSDASTVIKFTGNAGTYKLSTEGLNVQSQTAANKAFPATDAEGVDFVFSVSTPGVVTIRNAASASGDLQGDLHEGQDGSEVKGVINWQANAAASKWTVEAATEVSIPLNYDGSAYSYGTMYLPFGVTLTGAKAYILSVSGEWAIPSEIAEVPANTPVLIRAVGEVTSATATINDEATAVTTGNQLVGTFVDITTDRNAGEYILGNGSEGVAFYQRGSGKKIGANKAYLSLGADLGSGAVKGIRWDFTNDINSLNSKSTASQRSIFNLAGQRMSKTAKGVNIVDGKKVVIK